MSKLSAPTLGLSGTDNMTLTVSDIDSNASGIRLNRNGVTYKTLHSISPTTSNHVVITGSPDTLIDDTTGSVTINLSIETGYTDTYKLPETAPTITPSGAATVTYTGGGTSSGSLTITGVTSNISFTVVGEEIASGYTVTISTGCFYFSDKVYLSTDGTNYTEYTNNSLYPKTLSNVTKIYAYYGTNIYGITTSYIMIGSVSSNLLSGSSSSNPNIFEITADTTITLSDTSCLAADTLILTKDGYEEIKDIKIGMELLTYNAETKQNEYCKVLRWWHHPSSDLVTINSGLFTMTGDHPIYINDYEVVKGREVKVGDYLINKDGEKILVTNVEFSNEPIEVYMIEVENNHNFYITEQNILSHNY